MPDSIRRRKAAIFQALGHPTRIAILELLEPGERSAGALIQELSRSDQAAAQANVSQHLAVLRSQQIVKTRKAGNQVFYSVRNPVIHQVLVLLRGYLEKPIATSCSLSWRTNRMRQANGKRPRAIGRANALQPGKAAAWPTANLYPLDPQGTARSRHRTGQEHTKPCITR